MSGDSRGRGWKLTEERKRRIVDGVRAGNYFAVAAQWAGIGESTFYKYKAEGEKLRARAYDEGVLTPDNVDEANALAMLEAEELGLRGSKNPLGEVLRSAGWEPHEVLLVELVDELERAESEAELRLVTQWNKAADQDWRAAMTLLARRHPERWADQSKVKSEVSGPDGGPIEVSQRADLARAIAEDPEARQLASNLLAKVAPSGPVWLQGADLDESDGEDDLGDELDQMHAVEADSPLDDESL